MLSSHTKTKEKIDCTMSTVSVVNYIIILSLLSMACISQRLYIHSPSQLAQKYSSGIQIYLSPLGFNPRSGQLDGTVVLANPLDACTSIQNVDNEQQDVFIMANDQTCYESIKAKNILKSGGLVGIVKQNSNTTLHDKQINVVHISIVQLDPNHFDEIATYMSENPTQPVSMSVEFSSQIMYREILAELWMSPTEIDIYKFLLSMQKFLNNEINQVEFQPRYAMHSQKEKKTFIGCYSNGLYCPGQIQYDGKREGQNIIQQTLRQIVIRNMGLKVWWRYIKQYYVQCLHNNQGDVMLSSKSLQVCSKNSMMLANINSDQVQKQMNQSFTGSRKQVDDNTILRQERQDYVRQSISSYPVMLINKKQYRNIETSFIENTICKMESVKSKECEKLLTNDLDDTDIYIILGVIAAIVIVILVGYKIIMYKRMQTEMRGQVNSTLEQYYRYMDTLQGESGVHGRSPLTQKLQVQVSGQNMQNKGRQNQNQKQENPQIEIQLGKRDYQHKTQKPSKEGHTSLVEEEN